MGALLAALSEPLVTVRAGRLTRKLSAPSRLQPVLGERGSLSLWILPNDDLSLVWQSEAAMSPDVALATELVQQPCRLAGCSAVLWTEVARFPAGCHLADEAPRESMRIPLCLMHSMK